MKLHVSQQCKWRKSEQINTKPARSRDLGLESGNDIRKKIKGFNALTVHTGESFIISKIFQICSLQSLRQPTELDHQASWVEPVEQLKDMAVQDIGLDEIAIYGFTNQRFV